jgi:glycosyltransferase involved in cell wall biosynthesis
MMKIMSARVPQASLTIVGGPDNRSVDYWNSLLAKAKETGLDNILFVGRHEDVNSFLRRFKVFVMASDRQGCSNASLEAMAMKLPVVANRCGGRGEQIEDGVNGYLISDPTEMAHRVESLLINDQMRKAFGEAGYKIVREHFSMERMVGSYSKVLDGGFVNVSDGWQPISSE